MAHETWHIKPRVLSLSHAANACLYGRNAPPYDIRCLFRAPETPDRQSFRRYGVSRNYRSWSIKYSIIWTRNMDSETTYILNFGQCCLVGLSNQMNSVRPGSQGILFFERPSLVKAHRTACCFFDDNQRMPWAHKCSLSMPLPWLASGWNTQVAFLVSSSLMPVTESFNPFHLSNVPHNQHHV